MSNVNPVDWQSLYAANRAAIARGTVSPPGEGVRESPGWGRLAALTAQPPNSLVTHDVPAVALPQRARVAGLASRPAAPAPSGGWEEVVVSHAGGRRRAFVHAPAGLEPGQPVPLVCMLHGCTQDPASFAAATGMNEVADRHGFVVVYPQQERAENPQGCWNWFEPGHQERGAGEPASLAAVVRHVLGTTAPWTIDADRVFVAGLSAGGAMAAILAATYPDLFAAAAVHSGLAYRSAAGMGPAFAAMSRGSQAPDADGRAVRSAMGRHARPLPLAVVHGDADTTVAPVNGRQLLEQFMAANRAAAPDAGSLDLEHPASAATEQAPGGHGYSRRRWTGRDGALLHELVTVQGMGHAWSGGTPGGSFTDPRGPGASALAWRFFADAVPARATAGA